MSDEFIIDFDEFEAILLGKTKDKVNLSNKKANKRAVSLETNDVKKVQSGIFLEKQISLAIKCYLKAINTYLETKSADGFYKKVTKADLVDNILYDFFYRNELLNFNDLTKEELKKYIEKCDKLSNDILNYNYKGLALKNMLVSQRSSDGLYMNLELHELINNNYNLFYTQKMGGKARLVNNILKQYLIKYVEIDRALLSEFDVDLNNFAYVKFNEKGILKYFKINKINDDNDKMKMLENK